MLNDRDEQVINQLEIVSLLLNRIKVHRVNPVMHKKYIEAARIALMKAARLIEPQGR